MMMIILAIVVILVLWFIFGYNKFVRLITRSNESWADIDVQLKRRYDLIPNLINSVKGYMTHEASTFEKVTQARSQAMQAGTLAEKGKAEDFLGNTLKSLFAVAESYPDLKANQNFLSLQSELADTENKIQAARRFYNVNVRDLNISVDSFPSNIIAKIFSFAKKEFFGVENEAEKQPVAVKF